VLTSNEKDTTNVKYMGE